STGAADTRRSLRFGLSLVGGTDRDSSRISPLSHRDTKTKSKLKRQIEKVERCRSCHLSCLSIAELLQFNLALLIFSMPLCLCGEWVLFIALLLLGAYLSAYCRRTIQPSAQTTSSSPRACTSWLRR